MRPARAICTGFRDELVATLRELGDTEPLADVLPFVEACGADFADLADAAVSIAAARFGVVAPRMVFGANEAITPKIRVRRLSKDAFTLLARYDDLALGGLYRAVATMRGLGAPTPDLAGLLRAFVIHCRASLANGWDVLLLESDPASTLLSQGHR